MNFLTIPLKYFFLISVLLAFFIGKSQKINENKFYSEYKYVLKLDSAQLRFLIQKNKVDTAWVFKNIIDSFYKDSNYNYSKLGYGTYLTCWVNQNIINFSTYHKHPFGLDVWGVNTKNYVIVKDEQGKIIEDAKVSLLNGKICNFSLGMASYELPKVQNGTIVKIEYQGSFDYILINPSYYNAPKYKNNYPDYSHTTILPGYIALNQPKYKQNDTLKFKAFLVNDDGTYYFQKIGLWLRSDYDGKEKLVGYYKYKTPGAYFGEFVLGDTLTADRTYTLIFRNSLKEDVKSIGFQIENYELKKNTYELSMANNLIYPGQKIIVIAKARDANNLPVMDGYVKYNIRLGNVQQVHTNKFFVPNTWYQSLYSFEQELDPSGYTVLEIPDTLFPNFDCQITIDAIFTNEDNELINRSTYFQYQNKNHTYSLVLQKDSIKADYFFQSKSSIRELRLVTVYNNYLKVSKNITSPYIQKIDYAAVRYELFKNDTLVANYNCQEIGNVIGVFGKRTHDSVFIKLYNPLLIPVHYEIYKDKKKVAEGKSEQIDFKVADISTNSYYIIWGHNYMGALRNNYKTQAFHYQEKKLNIELNQPEEVYPGQDVNISIKVLDAQKKPLEGVNLTAYSVNTQFGEIPLPDVPYMGLIRNDEPLHFTQPNFQVFNTNANLKLKIYHINALNLYRNEMYKLMYSIESKTILNFKTDRKNPEYAVYLLKLNNLEPIVSIVLDDQIVYHSRNSFAQEYSFRSNAGKHNLKVRTNSFLVNYGEVIFEDSNKYIIGINLDNIIKTDTTRLPNGMFEKKEFQNYLAQTFLLHIDEGFDTLRIYQGNHLCFFGNHNTQYKNIYIGSDLFRAFTLPEKGEIRVVLNGLYEHELNFEPNKIYYLNKNEVRSYLLDAKGASVFTNFDNTANYDYNTSSFQQLYTNPDIKIVDTTKKALTIIKQKKQRARPYIYYRDYTPTLTNNNALAIYQKHNNVPYKRAWLINKSDEKKSVISNYRIFINYPDSGYYDLILLNDTAMCITQNLYLPPNGTLHLFLYANEIKELDQDEIFDYEQTVKRLTKIPLRLFTDSPVSIRPKLMKMIKSNNPYGKLSGNVEDAIFNTPLDLTTIIAEIDGVYKGGALTNADGEFEINFLPPGNYMLKVRVSGYRYQVVYNLQVEKGIEKVLKIKLLNLEDTVVYGIDGVVIYGESPRVQRGEIGSHISGKEAPRYSSVESYDAATSYSYTTTSGSPTMVNASVESYQWNSRDVVVTSSNESLNNGVIESSTPIEKINADKMQQRLNDLAQEAGANRVRNVFRDYGYWVPNLVTNKQGIANFSVRFPDNITSWKTMVPAMNGNRQSGLTTMVTKSYKPLIGAMATPSFLVAGDIINLKGKVINYTGNLQDVKINFSLDNNTRKEYLSIIDKVATDTFTLSAPKAFDTLKTSFSLKMVNGYTDGEERLIPVKPNGILISRSEYLELIKDTSILYIVPADVLKAIVYVHNSEVEQLKKEIEELKNYGYGCTEQTTSKLRAMLAEKAIAKSLKIPFTGDKQVKQLIKQLEKLKNVKGTWGWWENASEDLWLTMYVVKTLNEARLAGYSNNHYTRAANKIEDELPGMELGLQLEALNLLKDMDRKVLFDTFIQKMDYTTFDVRQKLLYIRLKQRLHQSYDLGDIISLSNTLPNGALSWGEQNYNYKYDQASNTLLAFDILRKDSMGRVFLPNVKSYFNSTSFTRHTLARASLISLYLNDWTEHHQKNENIFGELKVDGTLLKSTDFPFSRTYKSNDTIQIQHKGNESYANIVTQKIETKPVPDETYFRIKSTINQQVGNIVLKPGVITTIVVEVEIFKSSENVMIEIPLPAGFSYYAKPQRNNYVETHREYFNDRTSIFCNSLARGKYTFTIQVVPKYTGTFNLPPAKIELMYYPEIRNYEVPKVIEVKN